MILIAGHPWLVGIKQGKGILVSVFERAFVIAFYALVIAGMAALLLWGLAQ